MINPENMTVYPMGVSEVATDTVYAMVNGEWVTYEVQEGY